jgi:hypothetical protein
LKSDRKKCLVVLINSVTYTPEKVKFMRRV